ncbi:MAG: nitroreductase family protein [Lentisphaerae bacterium]|nr:nitroreductase family protein [Lentisphaerota bacterium]
METLKAIAKRHSYRGGFKQTKVSRDTLKKIVEAAIWAPSGCNAQTTTFVIVDNPDLITQIAGIVNKRVVREASALIVCIAEHRPVLGDISFGVEDCAAAVQNMLLAITDLGLASVWLDGALRTENKGNAVGKLLGVPDNLEIRVMLPIGVPNESVQPVEKKPLSQRAWFNRYGDAP